MEPGKKRSWLRTTSKFCSTCNTKVTYTNWARHQQTHLRAEPPTDKTGTPSVSRRRLSVARTTEYAGLIRRGVTRLFTLTCAGTPTSILSQIFRKEVPRLHPEIRNATIIAMKSSIEKMRYELRTATSVVHFRNLSRRRRQDIQPGLQEASTTAATTPPNPPSDQNKTTDEQQVIEVQLPSVVSKEFEMANFEELYEETARTQLETPAQPKGDKTWKPLTVIDIPAKSTTNHENHHAVRRTPQVSLERLKDPRRHDRSEPFPHNKTLHSPMRRTSTYADFRAEDPRRYSRSPVHRRLGYDSRHAASRHEEPRQRSRERERQFEDRLKKLLDEGANLLHRKF